MAHKYWGSAIMFAMACVGNISALTPEQIWNENGTYVVPWARMSVKDKVFALEQYKEQIDYSSANLNKSFGDVDAEKVNSKAYETEVGYITYGLIAGHYCRYGDYRKCAEYHYKDYLQAVNCARELQHVAPIPKGCWGGTVGDHDLLMVVVDAYEMGGYYEETLPYYRILLNNWVEDISAETFEEKLSILQKQAANDDSLREGVEIIDRWAQAKKLAKTSKPKPLDPAVQHHKWFYSDKTEEVLKALAYYSKHKVKFMVEKAAKDKRPVIANKAKEYLANWDKPEAAVIISTAPDTGAK